THDVTILLPLLLAVTMAHGFTVLVLRRSILTEKVSRRGFHLSREYAIDPLEIIFAREVARPGVVALPPDARPDAIAAVIRATGDGRRQQRLYPVVDGSRRLFGVVTRQALAEWPAAAAGGDSAATVSDITNQRPVVAYADDPLRLVAYRMA